VNLKRKAQASLEMVIGLIILLVVAAVVISLVLYFLRKENIPNPREELSIRSFLDKCESMCKDMTSLDFCKYYYEGNDWNKNGIKNEIVKVGKYEWPTCEDRVYCFLVVPCEDRFGSGLNAIDKCRRLLCQTYLEKYGGDVELANQALLDDINFSPACNLENVPSADNWYQRVFSNACNDVAGGVVGTTTTLPGGGVPSPPPTPP